MSEIGSEDYFVVEGRVRLLELIRAPFWGKPGTEDGEVERYRFTGRPVVGDEEPEEVLRALRPYFKELRVLSGELAELAPETGARRADSIPESLRPPFDEWCRRFGFTASWMRDVATSTLLYWNDDADAKRRRAWDDDVSVYPGGDPDPLIVRPRRHWESWSEYTKWLDEQVEPFRRRQQDAHRGRGPSQHPLSAYVRLVLFHVLGLSAEEIARGADPKPVQRACATLAKFLEVPPRKGRGRRQHPRG